MKYSVLAVLLALASSAIAAEPLTFDQIVAKYDAATRLPDQIIIEQDLAYVPFGTSEQAHTVHSVFKKDGNFFDATHTDFAADADGKFTREAAAIRHIVNDKLCLNLQLPKVGGPIDLVILFADRKEATGRAMWALLDGVVLQGIVNGAERTTTLADILRNGDHKFLATEPAPGGKKVYVLSASSPYGEHHLSLDADTFLPVTIEIHKRPGNFDGKALVNDSVKEITYRYDTFRTTEVQHKTLLDSVHVQYNKVSKDGTTEGYTATIVRTSIQLNPVFDAKRDFQPDIPDGTPVVDYPSHDGATRTWSNAAPDPTPEKTK